MKQSKLSLLWDIITGKRSPLMSGCAVIGGKYMSATKGEITKEEYDNWCWAEDVIRAQRKLFLQGRLVYKKGELDNYRAALRIEDIHKPK